MAADLTSDLPLELKCEIVSHLTSLRELRPLLQTNQAFRQAVFDCTEQIDFDNPDNDKIETIKPQFLQPFTRLQYVLPHIICRTEQDLIIVATKTSLRGVNLLLDVPQVEAPRLIVFFLENFGESRFELPGTGLDWLRIDVRMPYRSNVVPYLNLDEDRLWLKSNLDDPTVGIGNQIQIGILQTIQYNAPIVVIEVSTFQGNVEDLLTETSVDTCHYTPNYVLTNYDGIGPTYGPEIEEVMDDARALLNLFDHPTIQHWMMPNVPQQEPAEVGHFFTDTFTRNLEDRIFPQVLSLIFPFEVEQIGQLAGHFPNIEVMGVRRPSVEEVERLLQQLEEVYIYGSEKALTDHFKDEPRVIFLPYHYGVYPEPIKQI